MIRVLVTYPRSETSTFDADYWLDKHMPLLRTNLGPHGLVKAEADVAAEGPFHAAAHLFFDDVASLGASMGTPEGAAVMADVANYTNVQPDMAILEVKQG